MRRRQIARDGLQADPMEEQRQAELRRQSEAYRVQAANNQASIRRVIRDGDDLPDLRFSRPFHKIEPAAPIPQAMPSLPGGGSPLVIQSAARSPSAADGPAAPTKRRGRPPGSKRQ